MAVAEVFRAGSDLDRFGVGTRLKSILNSHRKSTLVLASLPIITTLFVLLVPIVAPHPPLVPVGPAFVPPLHDGFILGTDSVGRDELSRVLYGMRSSWFAALAVIASGLLIGVAIGSTAAVMGGWIDTVLMRFTDVFLALPGPVLAIAVVAALGPGLTHTLIGVAIVWWPFYARIARGEIRALASRPHIEAARMAGVGLFRQTTRHLLPGAMPALVVTASLDVANLVLTLAGLSFLGLGAPAPAPELGAMSARNLTYLLQDYWTAVMPGIGIVILALVGNVSGDAIRKLMRDR
jgi:peptide/nickel transport system permease protein